MFLKHNYKGLLWALFILVLSGLPSSEFKGPTYQNIDLIIHAILYAILFVLLCTGFIKQRAVDWLRTFALIKTAILSVTYGALMEVLQSALFSSRSFELADILANTVGVGVGVVFFLLVYGKKSYV